MKGTITRRFGSLALVIATASGAGIAPANGDVQKLPSGDRVVIVQSLTLWNAPSGGSNVGTLA